MVTTQQPPVDGQIVVARGMVSDASLVRVSVEIARQYPREELKIITSLLAALDAHPQFAERCVYRIPYQDKEKGQVWVSGLSIRAAEMMATAWGHLRVGVRIVDETDDYWDVEAMAWDMQTNYWELTPARETKWLKRRDGRMEQLDERRLVQKFGAAVSKVKRKCLLSVLPITLRAAFEERVNQRMAGGDLGKLADKARVAMAVDAFRNDFGVDEARIVAHVGKPREQWTGRDLADLRALYAALADGETTVAEAFGGASTSQPKTETPKDDVPGGRSVDPQPGDAHRETAQPPPAAEPAASTSQAETPPAAEPAGTTESDDAIMTRVSAEIKAARTIVDLNALLPRYAQAGGPMGKRNLRVKILGLIGERKEQILKEQKAADAQTPR